MARKKAAGSEGDGAPPPGAPAAAAPSAPINASPGAPATTPYVVLARKYRPETFDQLIGQSAMVTTLENAFASDRIAQAYMLTGVRGVGKTTTARIIARGLNYAKEGWPDRPTVRMDGYGVHCRDIIASRHADVLEMDAASNTGVDDVREIIENARYKPLLARYKVFIVDEVHMLSKSAFNALLKTLEEPPAHVKFIFATTEIRKVPVTVLSRCQRFDLRRVDVPELARHFAAIAAQEGATVESEALTLIARAAGGSVRDGLSILDQAIAMGAGRVTDAAVRAMLGLADRGRVFDLIEHLLGGRAGDALAAFERLHLDGADPIQLLTDLAEAVHATVRVKVAGADAQSESLSAEERRRAAQLASRLSVPILARAWQMLLKGIDEAGRAPNAKSAAEMVLVRLAYTADLPTPDEVIKALGGEDVAARGTAGGGATAREAASSTAMAVETRRAPAAGPAVDPLRHPPSAPPSVAGSGVSTPVEGVEAPGGARDEPPPWEPDAELADLGDGLETDDVAPARPALADPRSFAEVVRLAGERRDARLKLSLEDHVSLVRFEPGRIDIHLLPGAPATLAGQLAERLGRWTGQRWVIAVSREKGERPLGEVRREQEAAELAELRAHPAVKAVLDAFPGAEIKEVRPIGAPAPGSAEDDETGTG